MAPITDTTGKIGLPRNARGGMPSMRHLGLNTSLSLEYLRCGSLDPWGQPYPNPDENPGALASGNLEFFWCGNDPDVGIT